jgi:flagellar biosynthesis/type III secretory pathway protein FliH
MTQDIYNSIDKLIKIEVEKAYKEGYNKGLVDGYEKGYIEKSNGKRYNPKSIEKRG